MSIDTEYREVFIAARRLTPNEQAAATLVLAAEIRALRRDLRSAQTPDLTDLVDTFRKSVDSEGS